MATSLWPGVHTVICALAILIPAAAAAQTITPQNGACPDTPGAMGSARIIEVDTSGGPDIGTMQYASTLPLGPKELVLTFDDGPNPEHTPKILDALDAHCIKATFFMVGRYAQMHPDIVREVWRRGHTVATHTWSHPILSKTYYKKARTQIDRGFDAVRTALAGLTDENGTPAEVAPFFRFPGLNHTNRLRAYLGSKDIATFSCDIGTDDWRGISPRTLYKRALSMIAAKGSGVVIFHDTHHRTSFMLPQILDELARRGYTTVQIVPKGDSRLIAARAAEKAAYAAQLERAEATARAIEATRLPTGTVAQVPPSFRPSMAN